MLNLQTPEPRAVGDGQSLELHSIFYTVQGEGIFSGCPALFIRLAGCNLRCPGCDTEYTQGRLALPTDSIVERAVGLLPANLRTPLVVITGGEPFRQNINQLISGLLSAIRGLTVQIETNGTYSPLPGCPSEAIVICSPKAGKVADGLIRHVKAYKYVLDSRYVSLIDGLPTDILGNECLKPARPPLGFKGPIYLSPLDSGRLLDNDYNIQAAAKSCMGYGYILNLQIHKLVGLP